MYLAYVELAAGNPPGTVFCLENDQASARVGLQCSQGQGIGHPGYDSGAGRTANTLFDQIATAREYEAALITAAGNGVNGVDGQQCCQQQHDGGAGVARPFANGRLLCSASIYSHRILR
ncbi:MAG: hypothetical protein V2A73_08545 [Pseudomonadota bacterium]